ncbi:glycosyltransferase [Naasia sp. SYSU D00948]|uniref:glycosyltransferase n=1 Tax=Naasia sp. SYSU D00948 TaxID=2817379 RepID=UPI001B30E494|nr:glycosyltransferase [Naasia sp. SYSU D00948]
MTHVAVVMPAFNEADALREFVPEVVRAVRRVADRVSVVVVDDASADGTADAVRELDLPAGVTVAAIRNDENLGHGPSALRAYAAGYSTGAEWIVHVDGDGQFLGEDVAAVVAQLAFEPAARGVRRHRRDPWYRKAATLVVMLGASALAGGRIPDVNTPLRAYRRPVLGRLLAATDAMALVPHVHFSILERTWRLGVGKVRVRHVARRGRSAEGSMWGGGAVAPKLPPRRLLVFIGRAAVEVWHFRVRRAAPRPVPLPED